MGSSKNAISDLAGKRIKERPLNWNASFTLQKEFEKCSTTQINYAVERYILQLKETFQ